MNNPNNFRPVRRPQQSGNKGYGTAIGAVNKRKNKKSKLPVLLCLALIFAILLATVVIRSIGRTPEKNDQKKSDKQTVSVIKETAPVDEFVSLMEPFEYTDETLPFSKDFTFTNAILIDLET